MSVRPVPDLTVPQNKGFVESDTAPIIHSVRWRHLPSRYIFTDVNDVITYHQDGPLTINMELHSISYLDIYFLRGQGITDVKAYLRFARAKDSVLIEEPYTVGEGGKAIKLADDPVNSNLQVLSGIAFTQLDIGDGTPMYDFMQMAEEGIYEVWIKATTNVGNELHLRVPFQWAFKADTGGGSDSGGSTEEPKPPIDKSKLDVKYDEYYFTVVEGESVFTKKPATAYRPAGIGMLENAYCFTRRATPQLDPLERPALTPIVGDEPIPECGLTLSETEAYANVGEVAEFYLEHVNTTGVAGIKCSFNESALRRADESKYEVGFVVLKSGTYPVEITVLYEDGQECIVEGDVVGEKSVIEDGGGSDGAANNCALGLVEELVTSHLGIADFSYDHDNTTKVVGRELVYDKSALAVFDDGNDTFSFKCLKTGTFPVTARITYDDGQVCEVKGTVEAKEVYSPSTIALDYVGIAVEVFETSAPDPGTVINISVNGREYISDFDMTRWREVYESDGSIMPFQVPLVKGENTVELDIVTISGDYTVILSLVERQSNGGWTRVYSYFSPHIPTGKTGGTYKFPVYLDRV